MMKSIRLNDFHAGMSSMSSMSEMESPCLVRSYDFPKNAAANADLKISRIIDTGTYLTMHVKYSDMYFKMLSLNLSQAHTLCMWA